MSFNARETKVCRSREGTLIARGALWAPFSFLGRRGKFVGRKAPRGDKPRNYGGRWLEQQVPTRLRIRSRLRVRCRHPAVHPPLQVNRVEVRDRVEFAQFEK